MPRAPERSGESGVARVLRWVGRGLVFLPRWGAVTIAIAWCGLIWFLSAQHPASLGIEGDWAGVVSNFAHAPEYGILAAWLALCSPRADGWPVLSRTGVAWILAILVAYAGLDELHQSFVPHRDASMLDVVTDLVGACVLLRVVHLAGPHAPRPAPLWRTLLVGAVACLCAAIMSTFIPPLFPTLTWL